MARRSASAISPWVSAPRILVVLVISFFVALGSGTNDIYSAYSPQLGARLNMSHTQLNIVGLAGNAGVYCSAPVWGKVVDSRGPRIPLVVGSRSSWVDILASNTSMIPVFHLRGSTTGLVLAGFGLSAFFFTTLSNTVFRSTTSTFLLILALGTSSLMVLGFFLVHPIPPPDQANSQPLEDGDDVREALLPALQHHNHSCTTLLNDDSLKARHARYTVTDIDIDGEPSNSAREVMQVTHSRGQKPITQNIHGKALCCSPDFWLLISIYSMVAGTGVTYKNNVGSISRSLYAHNNPQRDEAQALRWQAAQVSTISLTNFGGRILIGFFSDFVKSQYATRRSHSLALVAFLYLISQVVAANVSNISDLWVASALLGLAHGSLSGLIPTVEWFGLFHFSENLGYIFMSLAFSAGLFSFLVGRNLDTHEDKTIKDLSPSVSRAYGPPQCLQGRECYADAIYLTIGATFLSFLLSIWAGYRDSQKAKNGGDIVGEER